MDLGDLSFQRTVTTAARNLRSPRLRISKIARCVFTTCANNIDCFHELTAVALLLCQKNKSRLTVGFDFGQGTVVTITRKTEEHIWADKIRNSPDERFCSWFHSLMTGSHWKKETISAVTHNPIRNVGNKWADFQIVNFNQIHNHFM